MVFYDIHFVYGFSIEKIKREVFTWAKSFSEFGSVEIATEQFKDFNSRAFTGLNIFLVETLLSQIDNSGN